MRACEICTRDHQICGPPGALARHFCGKFSMDLVNLERELVMFNLYFVAKQRHFNFSSPRLERRVKDKIGTNSSSTQNEHISRQLSSVWILKSILMILQAETLSNMRQHMHHSSNPTLPPHCLFTSVAVQFTRRLQHVFEEKIATRLSYCAIFAIFRISVYTSLLDSSISFPPFAHLLVKHHVFAIDSWAKHHPVSWKKSTAAKASRQILGFQAREERNAAPMLVPGRGKYRVCYDCHTIFTMPFILLRITKCKFSDVGQ